MTFSSYLNGRTATVSKSHVGWARQTWQMMQQFTTGAFYVNNLLDEDASRIRAAYGGNFERLVALKRKVRPNKSLPAQRNVPPGS